MASESHVSAGDCQSYVVGKQVPVVGVVAELPSWGNAGRLPPWSESLISPAVGHDTGSCMTLEGVGITVGVLLAVTSQLSFENGRVWVLDYY